MIHARLVSMVIRPALVSLGVTGILLFSGCKTVTEKWLFENNNPPPAPDLETRSSLSVVLPPPVASVRVEVYWESTNTADVEYVVQYGYPESSITNEFGRTKNWSITNSIPWQDGISHLYFTVYATNIYGSAKSYVARYPDWEPNAVKVWWEPPVTCLVFESPNLRHWVGYFATPPVTNSIVSTQCFYMANAPVAMSIEPLRLWNGKHYGK